MKHALVTGGTKGIGKSIAKELLKNGYLTILNYSSDDENANKVLEELSYEFPQQIKLVKGDLSSIANIDVFCMEVKVITQTLDVLILNAGITDRSTFLEITKETWCKVIDTNITIPFFIIQNLVLVMTTDSSIVFTGSAMGIYPHSSSLAYGVTKSAIHALVRNLVKFLSPYKIRINALAPGFIDTDWQANKSPELRGKIESKIGLKRFGTTGEVADACLFLIRNKYINGAVILLDGGYNFK